MSECRHEHAKRPSRPVPDYSTTCPNCGERVALRGDQFKLVRHLNAEIEARRELLEAYTRTDVFREELAEAAALIEADDTEGLTAFLSRDVEDIRR